MKRATRSKPETVKVGNVTVRIYKRSRQTTIGNFRTVFEVADYSEGVRRFRGFSDRPAAVEAAKGIAGKIASGDVSAASLSNAESASYGRAVELLRPTGASLELAASTFAKCFELLGGDNLLEAARHFAKFNPAKVEQRLVADVIADLLAVKAADGCSADYLTDLRQRLKRFAERFTVDISTVTTADVQMFLDGLKLGKQSKKNFRTVLGTLFSFAEARGYLLKGSNPVLGTEEVKVKSNGGSIAIFAPDEIAKLLQSATPRFLPVVAIGAFAGLRTAEVERLEWSDLDLARGFIHVGEDMAKTASRRLVPISANLAAWLAPYAGQPGKVWQGTASLLQKDRAACVKAAGVAWQDNGLRHSFISYRLAAIQNAAQVALEAGNSPAVVFKHYRELVQPSDAQAWFAVRPAGKAEVAA
ncbi:MAG: hypothetical protein RL514_283 [Verrucomicrobiota bacterium]|jgi:integrase